MCQKEANLHRMGELLEEAMNKYPDAQLVVFPELCVTGYQCGERFYELAERPEATSQSVAYMKKLAQKYKVHIVYGMAERDMEKDKIIYNSQFFLDDEGELIGTYHKVHLFDSEKKVFTQGNQFRVFDTKIGRIGLFICYDAFFPEAARSLAIQGVDVLVNSTNWEKPYAYDMDMVMTARALENTTYLVCSNRIGEDTTLGFFGHSRILNPLGQVICNIEGEVEGSIYASLDYDTSRQMKRDYYTMLTERRPEVYQMM